MVLNKVFFTTSLIVCLGFFQLNAQTKELKIEDLRKPALQPKTLSQLSWRGDAEQFVYLDDSSNLVIGKPHSQERNVLLSLKELNEKLTTLGIEAKKSFPSITWRDSIRFSFIDKNTMYQFNTNDKTVSKVISWEEGASNRDFDNGSSNLAYVYKDNLYVYNAKTQKNMPVTKDGSANLVYGQSVHREEFGIHKGTFWSPSGNLLAFYRMDQTMVTDYPQADYTTTPATPKTFKYPMAGGKSHHVTVGVYDMNTNKTLYLQTGEPAEQYLTNVTWSPDNQYIYIAVLNREQNKMLLNRYFASTGKLDKTLFEETHPKYVEPEHGPVFVPNKEEFLWFSKRGGWNSLYHYRTDGTLIKQVTHGQYNVNEILGFGAKDSIVYFTSSQESPIENNFYYIKFYPQYPYPIKMTHDRGVHRILFNKKANYAIDVYSNDQKPYIAKVINANTGGNAGMLLESENPLKDYAVSKPFIFQLQSPDPEQNLYCRMILPPNMNYEKKYPVLVYLYGGPHAQMVQDRWMGGADMFLMYMASQGYVVFTLDNRGSSGRNFNFENATVRNLGDVEMQDQMVGVNYLKKQSFVDTTRMGIYGWSFGGFMSTSMMLRNPGIFKAAVAGGPVIDWKMYEIMYTERYMDTPTENPDGYKKASLYQYIPNLKGRLLMIHGLQDDVVVPQHSASFVNECIAKGVLIDYFPYPNHPHNVLGADRVHLFKKIADYFDQHVKNAKQ